MVSKPNLHMAIPVPAPWSDVAEVPRDHATAFARPKPKEPLKPLLVTRFAFGASSSVAQASHLAADDQSPSGLPRTRSSPASTRSSPLPRKVSPLAGHVLRSNMIDGQLLAMDNESSDDDDEPFQGPLDEYEEKLGADAMPYSPVEERPAAAASEPPTVTVTASTTSVCHPCRRHEI
eukprot:1248030-Prymnesium_polylepis.2